MQATAAFNLGVSYLENRELDMALVAFSQAIRLDPQMAEAYNGRAVVRALRDELDSAMADSCEALRLAPWDPEFYRTRGYIYERMGEPDKARADLEQAEALERQLSEAGQSPPA
ncbi:MAG: tetratricopeptide repeat protein [Thermoguttaceae bacterium]